MAYRLLCQFIPRDLVNIVISYIHEQDEQLAERIETLKTTINFYIVFICPKVRQKYPDNWDFYLSLNPFICAYLLCIGFFN